MYDSNQFNNMNNQNNNGYSPNPNPVPGPQMNNGFNNMNQPQQNYNNQPMYGSNPNNYNGQVPPMQNPNPYGPTYNPEVQDGKKGNKTTIIVVLAVVLVILLGVGIFLKFQNKNTSGGTTPSATFKSSQKRKEESIEQLKKEGIDYLESLPLVEDSTKISLRSKKDILARAIASYAAANVAIDYNWNADDVIESKETFGNIIDFYGVKDYLTEDEYAVLYGNPTEQVAVDVEWTIEASKTLFWILGFIDELNYPNEENITDANEISKFLVNYDSFDAMLNDVKMLDAEKILDYTDLYYRYHWALRQHDLKPETKIGNLYWDIVYERRRALEWTINSKEDWIEFNSAT